MDVMSNEQIACLMVDFRNWCLPLQSLIYLPSLVWVLMILQMMKSFPSESNYLVIFLQDTIHTVYYAWAMQQMDVEELGEGAYYPVWKLREIQQLGVQSLIQSRQFNSYLHGLDMFVILGHHRIFREESVTILRVADLWIHISFFFIDIIFPQIFLSAEAFHCCGRLFLHLFFFLPQVAAHYSRKEQVVFLLSE